MNMFITSLLAECQLLFSILGLSATGPAPASDEYPITYDIEMSDYASDQTKFQIPETGSGEIRDCNYTCTYDENGNRCLTPIDYSQPMSCSVTITYTVK